MTIDSSAIASIKDALILDIYEELKAYRAEGYDPSAYHSYTGVPFVSGIKAIASNGAISYLNSGVSADTLSVSSIEDLPVEALVVIHGWFSKD